MTIIDIKRAITLRRNYYITLTDIAFIDGYALGVTNYIPGSAINNFYKNRFKIIPNIAVLGLNPHCETKSKINEENKVIIPAIKKLKDRKIKVSGPFPADTFFLKKNIKKFNSVLGMYHDQVLTPFKTLFGFNASNITLGLPFLRISVDHGPNENMIGKNKSNSKSLENIFSLISSVK